MKVKPLPVTILRPTILLTDHVWAELDRLATERNCSRNDLGTEVSRRLCAESDFSDRMDLATAKIIQLRQAGKPDSAAWPSDPLDCLAVAICMAVYLEHVAEHKILAMTEEDLDFWNREVKRTGRSFEYLISQSVFGPQLKGA